MSKKLLLILSLFIISGLACQKKNDNPQNNPPATPVRPQSETVPSCPAVDTSYLDQRIVVEDKVKLIKLWGPAVYVECNGQKSEVHPKVLLSSPNKNYTIHSELGLRTSKVKWVSSRNRTTCVEGKTNPISAILDVSLDVFSVLLSGVVDAILPGDQSPKAKYTFMIDYAPTIFHTEVDEGVNYIDYSFFGECKGETASVDGCSTDDRQVLEEGTVKLIVDYKEEFKQEITEIDRCQKEVEEVNKK